MEEVFALDAGRCLDLVHPLFEKLGSDGTHVCACAVRELGENDAGGVGGQQRRVFRVGSCGFGIVVEDGRGFGRKLVEMVDAGKNQRKEPREPCLRWGCGAGEALRKIRVRKRGQPLRVGELDVVPVEPVQLIEIKDCGRGGDALEREDLCELVEREGFGLAVFCAPA
jgi:hypothetical protein